MTNLMCCDTGGIACDAVNPRKGFLGFVRTHESKKRMGKPAYP
jgi:hypothetical protein